MLGWPQFWSLTAISVATGIAMLLVFGRFSEPKRIELAKRKIRAHLYEFRLFADEPAMMLRAQKGLLAWNARYLALMLRPTAVVLLPMAALLFYLDPIYGERSLRPGERAVLQAEMPDIDLREIVPALTGRGIEVETPPVRVPDRHVAYWRIRATDPAGGRVLLRVAGQERAKSIRVGTALHYPLPSIAGLRIGVSYPSAELDIFGIGVHWMVWFFVVSSITMLVLRRRFHVTF